ncbi:MAG: ATP-binding protein [Bacteroidota bacterium]
MSYRLLCILMLIGVLSSAQNTIQELYKISDEGFKTGKYDDALIANIKALKLAEQNKDCPQIAYAYLQIGKMQYYNKENRQALGYFLKGLRVIDSCNLDSLRHKAYHNIGSMYTELSKIDSALIFLEKSKSILEKTDNYASLSKVNAVMAELYMLKIKDYNQAEKLIVKAEEYAVLSKDKKWIAFALMKRGILYKLKKDYSKALISYKAALKNYEEMDAAEGKLYSIKNILDVMSLTGNPEANDYLFKYIALKDSVFKQEGAAKMAEYKARYETEKKESENKLLQQQNKLNQVEIDSKNKAIISLLAGVLLIIIIVFWRLSVINLKKKNRELEATKAIQKEKERISRDLHDNVGGQLSYVLYSLDGINTENQEKREELISNINGSVKNVISNLRETIWAISDESISVNDFSDKLKVYARTIFKNTKTKIIFNERVTNNVELSSLVGLNLYRICQEVINNAFKYAQAAELKVDIESNDRVTIIISDNGKGFDIKEKSSEGFGLSNIKARAGEFGITIDLETEINKGVVYTLVV